MAVIQCLVCGGLSATYPGAKCPPCISAKNEAQRMTAMTLRRARGLKGVKLDSLSSRELRRVSASKTNGYGAQRDVIWQARELLERRQFTPVAYPPPPAPTKPSNVLYCEDCHSDHTLSLIHWEYPSMWLCRTCWDVRKFGRTPQGHAEPYHESSLHVDSPEDLAALKVTLSQGDPFDG